MEWGSGRILYIIRSASFFIFARDAFHYVHDYERIPIDSADAILQDWPLAALLKTASLQHLLS